MARRTRNIEQFDPEAEPVPGLTDFLWQSNAPMPAAEGPRDGDLSASVEPLTGGVEVTMGDVIELGRTPKDAPRVASSASTPAGMVAEAVKGAARKPLVHQDAKPSALDPEVADFVMKNAGGAVDPKAPQMPDGSRTKGAKLLDLLDSAGGDFAAAADMYSGRPGPRIDRSHQGDFADQLRGEDQKQEEAVRRFVLEKQARGDKDAARMLEQQRWDAEMKLKTQPKPTDPLEQRKKEAEIAKLQAETAKLGRPGGGGDPMARRKRELEIKKLEMELANGGMSEEDQLKLQKLRNDVEKGRQAITGEDPEKVKAAEQSLSRLKGLTGELRSVYRKNGQGTELFGADAQRMKQLMTQIQLEAKNVAELGALSGPDFDLMQQLTGADPSSIGANVKGMLGMDKTLESMNGIDEWAENSVKSAREVYGGKGGAVSGARADLPRERGAVDLNQPPSQKVRVSNGSESFLIDPSDLADAERDGFKRVQ